MDWVLAGVGVAAVLAVAGSVVVIVGHPRSHPERVTEPESERALAAVGAPAPPIPVPASAPPPALPDPDVSRRAFLRRAAATAAGTALLGIGAAYLSFMWPRVKGGFGNDIDAGDATALLARVLQPDGTITPAFIPEARSWVVPLSDEQLAVSGFGVDTVAGGLVAVPDLCPPRLPGALVLVVPGLRVPVPLVQVLGRRRVLLGAGDAQPRPIPCFRRRRESVRHRHRIAGVDRPVTAPQRPVPVGPPLRVSRPGPDRPRR